MAAEGEELTRLVVLMHRFLKTSGALYYQEIWNTLQREFASELSNTVITEINDSIKHLNISAFAISINGDNYSTERIYQIIAEGDYFGDTVEYQTFLKALESLPLMPQLFWQQFYAYTVDAVELVSLLFDTILAVEQSEKYSAMYAPELVYERCIYCLSVSGKFTSEEHIFPESLGNDELVLPKGFVCDVCNNQTLSKLDSTLTNFAPIAQLRVIYVSYTKKGKLPIAYIGDTTIKKTRPGHIQFQSQSEIVTQIEEQVNGRTKVSFQLTGGKFEPRLIARAFYKIALGLVALEHGKEYACNSKFDRARGFILNGHSFANNLLLCTRGVPNPQVQANSLMLDEGTPFAISVFGVIAMFNLEEQPIFILNKTLSEAHFVSLSLS